jgi:hypothetical protein
LTFNSNNVDTSASGFIPTEPRRRLRAAGRGEPQVGTTGGKAQTYTAGATPGIASVTATIDNPIGTTIAVNPNRTHDGADGVTFFRLPVVTFTATVSAIPPAIRIPSGRSSSRSARRLGCRAECLRPAFVKTTQLGAGGHSITANYGGDGVNPSSTAAPLSHPVAKRNVLPSRLIAALPLQQALTVLYQLSVVAPGVARRPGPRR